MPWPKGVSRKVASAVNEVRQEEAQLAIPRTRYDAIFGVRFLRSGDRFPGLWELVKLDPKMNRLKVVTDANTRGQVIVLISREVQRIVANPRPL